MLCRNRRKGSWSSEAAFPFETTVAGAFHSMGPRSIENQPQRARKTPIPARRQSWIRKERRRGTLNFAAAGPGYSPARSVTANARASRPSSVTAHTV